MGASILQLLFCDFLYLSAFLLLFQVMRGKEANKRNIRVAFIALMLECFFAFVTSDYFHYKEWFESLGMFDRTHMEAVYLTVATISPTYLVFRIIVWGSALVLLSFTFKLTPIDFGLALFLFIVRHFITFSYARVSLCMAMIFCGLALVAKLWERKYLMAMLGATLIFVSFYFHKTAIFGIGISVLSLFLVKQSRSNLILIIVLIPFFIYLLTSFIDSYMGMEFSDTEVVIENGQRYIEGGRERFKSLTKNIFDVIWRIPYFLILFMYVKTVASNQFNTMPISIRVFANAAAFSVFVSLLFLFVPGIANFVLYYRFLNYAMIPSIVFVAYCHSNLLCPIMVKLFYYLSLIGVTLSLTYRVAIQLV